MIMAMVGDTEDRPLWKSYLRRLAVPEGPLSVERTEQILTLWSALEKRVGPKLKPPYAGPLENDGFAMSWDNGQHHLEIEVSADGSLGWFYMDQDSGIRRGEEGQPLGTICSEIPLDLFQAAGARSDSEPGGRSDS
jgi:hypothetical protein